MRNILCINRLLIQFYSNFDSMNLLAVCVQMLRSLSSFSFFFLYFIELTRPTFVLVLDATDFFPLALNDV